MPIFDQGYQHWKGPLSGHAWRWLAVARHGVRAQLKSRIVRLLLLIGWLPAVALIVVLALWGLLEQRVGSVLEFLGRLLPAGVVADPQQYRTAVWTVAYAFFFQTELFFSLFLVMAVGPNLISRDLRFNALPLYFSRPLRRIDYFCGKLGVIGFFLAATVLVPAVAAYVLGVAFSLDLGVARDTYRVLLASILYSAVIVISAGTLMLALSSLSRRTIYVGLAWVGLWFISASVSSILIGIRAETTRHQITEERLSQWTQENPPPPGVDMVRSFPIIRNPAFRPRAPGADATRLASDAKTQPEEEARSRWYQAWWEARSRFHAEAEVIDLQEARNDWRPACSYPSNLVRMGDLLLNTDSAWVTFGRAVERPRAAFGPAVRRMSGGGRGPFVNGPANDRLLADRMAWQFPWYWSGGILAGLVGLSVLILMKQVKSLDQLK
jgi:ABC-type transport system involved in multi-copper enzyme maturation permease subunit